MRKQTKIAAIVSAAALLALGASITSFAAVRGTWRMEDGEWYCYDKNGDAYENVFALNNGKEYYLGEDGMMLRSQWVEYDGSYYFVNSGGQKITNDWRLTTPYDDESADEEWFYFQSSGKRAENKKVSWKGHTYYFDSEGKMLTGWVTADSTDVANEEGTIDPDHTFYCDETGARVEGAWVQTTEPGADEDDADADLYYYYLKTNGKVQTKKGNNIKGQSYIFDNTGKMLSGWVAAYGESGANTSAIDHYEEIDGEDSTEVVGDPDFVAVYYCSDEDDGHVKKNKWIKTWRPSETYDHDDDTTQYWYWIEKDGKVYRPTGSDILAQKYKLEEGKLTEKDTDMTIWVTKKKVSSRDYFFNQNGEMLSHFMKITTSDSNADLKNGMYYLGGDDDGSMKTGSVSVKDDNNNTYKFYFGTKTTANNVEYKGVGITGNKSDKLYYMGMLIKATDYKYELATIGGHTFIVNQNGSIQHSAIQYKEDGDILINASKRDADNNTKDKNGKEYVATTFNNDKNSRYYHSVAKDKDDNDLVGTLWNLELNSDAEVGSIHSYVFSD